MAENSTDPITESAPAPGSPAKARDWRLHKHADYQRVYSNTRKQFAPLMTFFAAPRPPQDLNPGVQGPRIGLTTGRVLGKAVERNRIKRRMRAAVCQRLPLLTQNVDLVLHPRRAVLDAPFPALLAELERIFRKVQSGDLAARGRLPDSSKGKRA